MTELLADVKEKRGGGCEEWCQEQGTRTALDVAGFGGVPDGMLRHITREKSESCVWGDGMNGAEHAFLQTGRGIAFVFAVGTGGGVVVAGGFFLRVGSVLSILDIGLGRESGRVDGSLICDNLPAANNGVGAIRCSTSRVFRINMEITVVHNLDRLLPTQLRSHSVSLRRKGNLPAQSRRFTQVQHKVAEEVHSITPNDHVTQYLRENWTL